MSPELLNIFMPFFVMSIFLGGIFYLYYSLEKKAKELKEKKTKSSH